MIRPFTIFLFLIASAAASWAQQFPNKIDGYKVYDAKVSFVTADAVVAASDPREAVVEIGEPEVNDIGLSGITFSVGVSVSGADQRGRIDRITLKDLKINGISAQAREFIGPIELIPGAKIELPEPVRFVIGLGGIARGAYREFVQERPKWRVTGTVFVFGKFKKFGIAFKRVVPIRIDLEIANPVRGYLDRSK